jgi:hypothetical protein
LTHIPYPVRPEIIVIPDGGDKDHVRLSLRITPVPVPDHTDGAMSLAEWPQAVALWAKKVNLRVGDIGANGQPTSSAPIGPYPGNHGAEMPFAGAMDLWNDAFSPDEIKILYGELSDPSGDTPKAAEGQVASKAVAPAQIAPVIDVRTLRSALVDRRSAAAAAQVNRLLARTNGAEVSEIQALSAARSPGPDDPMTELEAWAGCACAEDAVGKLRESRLLAPIRTRLKAAIQRAAAGLDDAAEDWTEAESYEELEARLLAASLSGRENMALAGAVAEAAPVSPVELLAARVASLELAASEALKANAAAGDAAQEEPDPIETVRRKLAGILAFPTIAKFLGMAVDIQVPSEDWKKATADRRRGAVSATLGGAPEPANSIWTAYLDVEADAEGRPPYFGPCGMKEHPAGADADAKLVRGMLNLGATRVVNGAPVRRYSLEIIDVVNSVFRQKTFAQEELAARRSPGARHPDEPELGSRGIALSDHWHAQDEKEAAKRQTALETQGTGPRLLFAEDLVAGYRPAVGVAKKREQALKIDAARWRSVVGRSVEFEGLPREFVGKHFNAEREHGHTRSLVGRQGPVEHRFPELFVWTGDSLGAPAPHDRKGNEVPATAATDLPVGITYGLPPPEEEATLGLPPLREGRDYAFGVAAMFPNGCGPTVADAIAVHASGAGHLLGGANGHAFRFTRAERIPPPVVLLRAGTPIVTVPNLEALRGESLTTLVVRHGAPRAQRYLFPARVEFDRAEQQGMFGRDDEDKPRGAFQKVGAMRHPESGAFAKAIDGRIEPDLDAGDPLNERSRGPVLQFERPSPGAVEREYYPDGHSLGVLAEFRPVVPSNVPVAAMHAPALYRTSGAAVDSLPLMLELKPGSADEHTRGRIDPADTAAPDAPQGIRLGKVSVALAPASIVDVELRSAFDARAALSATLVGATLPERWGRTFGADTKDMVERLSAAAAAGRIDQLQGVTTVRLVHAVQKPLSEPVDRGVEPVQVTVAADDVQGGTLPSWKQIMQAKTGTLVKDWSEEGGATCFFAGSALIDAPSTGSLSLDARWEDWGPEMLREDAGKDIPWSFLRPPQFARLFTLSELSSATLAPNKTGSDEVDLLGPPSQPHGLSFTFRDGRARRLTTKMVSLSRFNAYYPEARATSPTPFEAGDCEKVSKDFEELWIPCNFRPPPPEVERTMPWFNYSTTGAPGDRKFVVERSTRYRVELSRNWYVSGEGEMIGLVFDQKARPVCDYAADVLKPFAEGITRWGRDPLHDSPVPVPSIPPKRFTGHGAPKDLLLVAGTNRFDGTTQPVPPLSVEVLPYPVHFDYQRGQFYCDIDYVGDDAGRAEPYMSFVQLGLARYQSHSVKGLELSVAVGEMIQLLPLRRATAIFRTKNDPSRFRFELRGPSDGRATTRLDVTALVRRDDPPGGPRWVPQTKRDGSIAEELNLPRAGNGGWTIEEFRMPRNRFRDHLGLLIEEHELMRDAQGGTKRKVLFGYIMDFGAPKP